MKIPASTMVKVGWVFLAIDLVASAICFLFNYRGPTIMCSLACVVWIVGIFIWDNVAKNQP